MVCVILYLIVFFSELIPFPVQVANCMHSSRLFIKIFQTIEARPHWYLSYSRFLAVLNALSPNSLSEAVLLGKSL